MINSTFQFSPEILSLFTLLVCFVSIIGTAKFFGIYGLYTYSAIVTITSNIQVLKLTQYSFISDPVALGTVLFSTTFAVDNILTEYYGANAAKKGLYISFFGYLFFVAVMNISVWHPAVIDTNCVNLHNELKALFSPSFPIFVSSLFAYFIGQRTDIFVFSFLKKISKRKWITIRSMLSMAIAAFADNFVFSFLAWIVFAKEPISMEELWKTYIFITYIMRLVIAVMCVPLVKLSKSFISEENNVQKF